MMPFVLWMALAQTAIPPSDSFGGTFAMFRRISASALLCCFALSAGFVSAQEKKKQKKKQPNRPQRIQIVNRGFAGAQTSLVANPKVQEDLKLSDEQKKTLNAAVKKVNSASRLNLRELSREEVREKLRELNETRKESMEELAKLVRKTLNKEQTVRLEQIKLQARGTQALFDRKIAGQLKVTDEQRKKMMDARREMGQERGELSEQLRNKEITIRDFVEQAQELQQVTDKKVVGVLTPEQQEAFKKMKGKILKLNRRTGIIGPAIQIRPGNLKRGNFKKNKKQVKKGDDL